MKIGLYDLPEIKNENKNFEFVKINNLDDVKNLIDIKVLIASISDESILNSFYKIFSFLPEIIFIPYIKNKDFNLIPKVMACGAKTFFMPPFEKNFKRIINYLDDLKVEKLQVEKIKIFQGIVGNSCEMLKVFETIKKVAPTDSVVLITGESGTGKELVARAIHNLSKRKDKIFIPVNCGAIPKDLIESELFGYRKGAFTGASTNKIGRFEAASEGTIFLDEIGELPLELQVKLLRVLQENEIQPLGASAPIKINARIIAATNQNLEKLVEEKKFREDLYYRLNVIQIHLPPLRERKEDIELLIDYFFKKYVKKHGKENKIPEISEETKLIMKNYHWQGNVRELENCIERLIILKEKGSILPSDLPPKFYNIDDFESPPTEKEYMNNLFKLSEEGIDLKELIDNIETTMILQALEKTGGVKEKAAKLLGIKRTTLIEKMKRKNLM